MEQLFFCLQEIGGVRTVSFLFFFFWLFLFFANFFVKLYQPAYQFLQFLTWLEDSWPSVRQGAFELDQEDIFWMIRMVFILWNLHVTLKSVKISVSDLSIYNMWIECRSHCDELIIHVFFLFFSFLLPNLFILHDTARKLRN